MEIWFKQNKIGLEWTTNGLGKPFRKKIQPKKSKKVKKNKVNLPREQKTTSEKTNFVQIPTDIFV